MDNRPVGVFDSGIGGLTAVREIFRILPGEDIIYFGDTGRVPYGSRSRETILKYTRQDIRFLRTFDIKAIVVACGTVSTAALDVISGEYDIPLIGVARASAVRAAGETKNRRVGLIGTEASIRSGAYERMLAQYCPEAEVRSAACPLFVPLVENGRIERGDVVIETVAREYLGALAAWKPDVLILGCTHYPLLKGIIEDVFGDGVLLIDSGAEAAENLKSVLTMTEKLAKADRQGSASFFVSDSAESFERSAAMFLGGEFQGRAEKIDIETF